MQELCNLNEGMLLKFSVHEVESGEEINSIKVTVAQLEDQQLVQQGKDGASFQMLRFRVKSIPSFADFLREGWSIQTTFAIDFTASNGNPAVKSSLHHFGPTN